MIVRQAGIATHYISSADIDDLEEALKSIDGRSNESVNVCIDTFSMSPPGKTEFKNNLPKINEIFALDSVEAIMERLEEEKDDPWAQQSLDAMKYASPTSLEVVFEQIKRGEKLELDECLVMEYKMSQEFMRNDDFFEGVRALLVDKDKKPQWNPPKLSDVKKSEVEKYFNAPEELVLTYHNK